MLLERAVASVTASSGAGDGTGDGRSSAGAGDGRDSMASIASSILTPAMVLAIVVTPKANLIENSSACTQICLAWVEAPHRRRRSRRCRNLMSCSEMCVWHRLPVSELCLRVGASEPCVRARRGDR